MPSKYEWNLLNRMVVYDTDAKGDLRLYVSLFLFKNDKNDVRVNICAFGNIIPTIKGAKMLNEKLVEMMDALEKGNRMEINRNFQVKRFLHRVLKLMKNDSNFD